MSKWTFFSSTLLGSILCTLLGLVFILAIILYSPLTEILTHHSSFVLMRPYTELDQYEQVLVSRMIREKTILSAETLWSLQSSFYQTIVSVLIALNAAILAIAFFIIRTSSKEEAKREASAKFDEYIAGRDFSSLVKKFARKEIDKINSTYGDLLDQSDQLKRRLDAHDTELDYLDEDIEHISKKLSLLDSSEDSHDSNQKIIG